MKDCRKLLAVSRNFTSATPQARTGFIRMGNGVGSFLIVVIRVVESRRKLDNSFDTMFMKKSKVVVNSFIFIIIFVSFRKLADKERE